MTGLRPLAVYPYPLPLPVAEAVRTVKVAMALDFQATIVEALPGGPTRVLAFGEPDFICDSVVVTNAAEMAPALAWVFGLTDEHPTRSLGIDKLLSIFGPGVTEVFDD